jgi:hypothetical protein
MFIALKIAKAGYYSGDPEKVLMARVDYVLAVLEYEKFTFDYEDVYMELNTSKGK